MSASTSPIESCAELPSAGHAATSLMMLMRLAIVWVCSELLYFQLPAAAALFVSLASGVLCSAVATQVWERRSRTAELSFSELMLWS